jgi:two-component system response regulator
MILLVEDNPDDEMLALRAFRRNQMVNKIVVARTGEEALELLLGVGTDRDVLAPRLVLLDLNLPKISGHEVLRQIRADARTKLLPVVVLSSSKEQEDIITSYELGANSYVRKAVGLGDFVDAVRVLGQFWLCLNNVASSASRRE